MKARPQGRSSSCGSSTVARPPQAIPAVLRPRSPRYRPPSEAGAPRCRVPSDPATPPTRTRPPLGSPISGPTPPSSRLASLPSPQAAPLCLAPGPPSRRSRPPIRRRPHGPPGDAGSIPRTPPSIPPQVSESKTSTAVPPRLASPRIASSKSPSASPCRYSSRKQSAQFLRPPREQRQHPTLEPLLDAPNPRTSECDRARAHRQPPRQSTDGVNHGQEIV